MQCLPSFDQLTVRSTTCNCIKGLKSLPVYTLHGCPRCLLSRGIRCLPWKKMLLDRHGAMACPGCQFCADPSKSSTTCGSYPAGSESVACPISHFCAASGACSQSLLPVCYLDGMAPLPVTCPPLAVVECQRVARLFKSEKIIKKFRRTL